MVQVVVIYLFHRIWFAGKEGLVDEEVFCLRHPAVAGDQVSGGQAFRSLWIRFGPNCARRAAASALLGPSGLAATCNKSEVTGSCQNGESVLIAGAGMMDFPGEPYPRGSRQGIVLAQTNSLKGAGNEIWHRLLSDGHVRAVSASHARWAPP